MDTGTEKLTFNADPSNFPIFIEHVGIYKRRMNRILKIRFNDKAAEIDLQYN